jgi:hypothetical protein
LSLPLVRMTFKIRWPSHRLNRSRNSIGTTRNLIPAGAFMMGSPHGGSMGTTRNPSIWRRSRVPYLLGVHELKQAQHEAVMGTNPIWFSANARGKARVTGHSTDRLPVE